MRRAFAAVPALLLTVFISPGMGAEAPAAEPGAKGAAKGESKVDAKRAESPEEIDRFLESWAGAMKDLKTLEIRFRQEKRMKILRKPLVSRGTILLSVPDRRLRSTVLDPSGKVETEILAEEKSVRIHYPGLRRLEVYDLGAGAAPPVAFPGLGGDLATLRRDYDLKLARESGGDRLELSPRDPASPILRLRLVLKDFLVKELFQEDRSGGSVRLEIEEFKKNPPLDPASLRLDVPPGTEEVRPLGKKRQEKTADAPARP